MENGPNMTLQVIRESQCFYLLDEKAPESRGFFVSVFFV